MNKEGAHVLVGIVSRKLGIEDACSEQDYAVFTNVSALLPWIRSSIEANGGMASCSFNISAHPTLGMQYNKRQLQTNEMFELSNMNIFHLRPYYS